MADGLKLAIQPDKGGRIAYGFVTPQQDRLPQIMYMTPKRVLPIIFLPGIMGSNLRLAPTRQSKLDKDNNIAWRPDSLGEAGEMAWDGTPAERQLQLDPEATEVDIYDPLTNPTGDRDETADERHGDVKVSVGITTPLLMDDLPNTPHRKTKAQKAKARGWGEVYFSSYQELLETCELRLHSAFSLGRLDPWWHRIVNVAPAKWGAAGHQSLPAITETDLKKALSGTWFPTHAMGYNWLECNGRSAIKLAKRIRALIKDYVSKGYECEKVIIVTHSMGGLVARALVHPELGNLGPSVLGIVHGVMPATGAAAAYKRMRCGFEDGIFNIPAKVLGNEGPEVTAVLANSRGGLELLPSKAYGNDWLQIRQGNTLIKSLPKAGDPYTEIYKLRSTWYGLLREEWLNPAQLPTRGYAYTCGLLDDARDFHQAIADTYHIPSFAHYGADSARPTWHNVVWELTANAFAVLPDPDTLTISKDSTQGQLKLVASAKTVGDRHAAAPEPRNRPRSMVATEVVANLKAPCDAGDQTVPAHSADHQLRSGKFEAVFRQTGYEHQHSYKDSHVLDCTLFSLVRIIEKMKWREDGQPPWSKS